MRGEAASKDATFFALDSEVRIVHPPRLAGSIDTYEESVTASLTKEMTAFPSKQDPQTPGSAPDITIMIWSPEILCKDHCGVSATDPHPDRIQAELVSVTKAVLHICPSCGHKGTISVIIERERTEGTKTNFTDCEQPAKEALKEHCQLLVESAETLPGSEKPPAPVPMKVD